MSESNPASAPQDTLVTFLLDRTGSMGRIKADTIGGFNEYLKGLKEATTPILFTFIQFDSMSIDKLAVKKPVQEVPELNDQTFQPRGSTPLIDAAYETIKATEKAIEGWGGGTPKVVICIQTDGEENCSTKHNWEELNLLIKEKSEQGWQFNFMGAGIDAYKQASRMGISSANTMSYNSADPVATRAAYAGRAASTAMFASGATMDMHITLNEKKMAGDKFDPALKQAAKLVTPKPEPIKPIVDSLDLT